MAKYNTKVGHQPYTSLTIREGDIINWGVSLLLIRRFAQRNAFTLAFAPEKAAVSVTNELCSGKRR